MTLGNKQRLFTRLITLKLFPYIYSMGLEATFGEVYRSSSLEAAAQKLGLSQLRHGATSTHELKLALDLNLFRNGIWLTKDEDYEPAGIFWEGLSTPDITCCWGGRFGDSDHFSVSHNGVK